MLDHDTAEHEVNTLIKRLLGEQPSADALILLAEILTSRGDELAEAAAEAMIGAAQLN